MKTAGKAFTAGFFGWLGAAAAITVTGVTVVLIGQQQVKRAVRDFEKYMREQTREMREHANPDGEL